MVEVFTKVTREKSALSTLKVAGQVAIVEVNLIIRIR
jgi:hypothetical protein